MAEKAKGKVSSSKLSTKSLPGNKTRTTTSQGTSYVDSEEGPPARLIGLNLELQGDPPTNDDYILIIMFNQTILLEGKWKNESELINDTLPINLNDIYYQIMVSSNPLVFILRVVGISKPAKQEAGPLLNTENRGIGTIDLMPLLLGEEEIFTTVRLVSLSTGNFIGCEIVARAVASQWTEHGRIPLLITMISAHCMPLAKDGTVYTSAIGLSDIHESKAIDFGLSLSTPEAKKIVWATISSIGEGANTAIIVPDDDQFVLDDLNLENTEQCLSFYWNAMNRVLVDSNELINRLSSPFLIEIAGLPKTGGKVEVRGRYMGWVDARALLEPGQLDVTICASLVYYNEIETAGCALLDLPPTSAKTASARETGAVLDENKHNAYVVIRLDLAEALVPKAKLVHLYDSIGYPLPEGPVTPVEDLDLEIVSAEPIIDARHIRKEAGALAVHEELTSLTYQGSVPMNKSIKRSAANNLLLRVRTMLKNFSPGDCSYIEWQDVVTGQHAASRRAVTASFAPQPERPHMPDREIVSNCKVAGDNRLAEKYVQTSLKIGGSNPRSLLCKALRCLEERNDLDARNYLLEALNIQPRNKYLLWILGAQEFDQGVEGAKRAGAALRIAVKGDYSDGTTNAIAWAAVHAFHHFNGNFYGAHVAAKKMRKAYSLPKEWKTILKRWSVNSGEKEILWSPSIVTLDNPFLIAAAFFLCLRCYKFCETLLQCVEKNCATRGSHRVKYQPSVDIFYLRAASSILRHQVDRALEFTEKGIHTFGPSAMMSQMRLTCVSYNREWDAVCEKAFIEAERASTVPCLSILYRAAKGKIKSNPKQSLQRAALVHKIAPSGHTALLIGRIFERLEEYELAERWCAEAVKIEPLLSDGWTMLCILALYERHIDKARAMLRTARQVGPITRDMETELEKVMQIVNVDQLPDSLVKNLCLKTTCE